jgi:hypothetical protein
LPRLSVCARVRDASKGRDMRSPRGLRDVDRRR